MSSPGGRFEGSDAALSVDNVWKLFGGVQAISGATFDIARGSITALIGPNGAGKTTLFNVITGFLQADGGRVLCEGRSILGKKPHVIARLGLVRTFQVTKALTAMSVLDNMIGAAPNQPGEHIANLLLRRGACQRRETEVRARAAELLDTFGLMSKSDEYAGTLSGGERKLLELARALMVSPRVVLLDEPMAGINPTLGERLLEYIRELRARDGITFVFIEHDMDIVMRHADRIIVLAEGRALANGSPEEIRQNPRVLDAYLGGSSIG